MSSDAEDANFAALYRGNLVPLHVILVGLTWILHDYFVTLEDEILYVWPQKRSIGKILFLWVRYYSIALLIFDTLQIHLFSIPGITSDNLCVAIDSIVRIVGAISLWSVEIVMQLRVYALFKCSKKVAVINGFLFAGSIAGFLWISVHNAARRKALIADAIHLPLPGCPVVHSGIEWAQWVPATAYEGVLFSFAIYKTLESMMDKMRRGHRDGVHSVLLRDNILYFLGISCLLVFNNLMVVGVTKIPWFSYGPFHAALGVLTTRMLLNLHKATSSSVIVSTTGWHIAARQERSLTWQAADLSPLSFGSTADSHSTDSSQFEMRDIVLDIRRDNNK
ncbi:uncharacterized protein EV420DRAFT_1271979 [Desarmillaria tabescens]|uniref:DUF6533 domain-containing protein n=1 Tax=Armillaria tabescens TaxID=1929756 RepID=A0AA39KDY8_ARMTA|nr:uncharacterized protein EV420DRAFT_1271979 [Desarmillaria tabescens]KAK0457033.1 hypothetical protein EV420DRAFT_1271979 [Desarmillaria tabescens]